MSPAFRQSTTRLILIGAIGVAAGFVLARTFALYRSPLMIHWLDAPPLC